MMDFGENIYCSTVSDRTFSNKFNTKYCGAVVPDLDAKKSESRIRIRNYHFGSTTLGNSPHLRLLSQQTSLYRSFMTLCDSGDSVGRGSREDPRHRHPHGCPQDGCHS